MTKRMKITVAAMFTALIVGGAAPGAFADDSVGTTAYRTVLAAGETQHGAVAVRAVTRALDAVLW